MNKALGLLGLARSANKLSIGSDLTIELLKKNKVFLVLLDKDTDSKTTKQIKKICDLNNVNVLSIYSSIELSHAIGETNIKVIGVLDKGFADNIYLNH